MALALEETIAHTQTHIYTQRTYQINQTYDDNLGNAYHIKKFCFNDIIKNIHILAPFTKASYWVRSSYNIVCDGFITWSTIVHTIVENLWFFCIYVVCIIQTWIFLHVT
jgi:hypothetical protein